MKLYGSTTSPYVRRSRIVLSSTPHEFIDLQIFSSEDRALLASRNPTMKVPCLEDDGRMIFDSRIIFNYLSEKLMLNPLTWEEENQLTLIDAANDSFVQLLLLQRSDVDVEADKLFFSLQKERINNVLDTLDGQREKGAFNAWNYPEISLYTLIDWVLFRQLNTLQDYPALLDFHEQHRDRIELTATDPRQ
jgi:glutathione S-transferase